MSNTKPAKKTAAKKTAAKKTSARAKVALTDAEKNEEKIAAFQAEVEAVEATVTQREWILICNRLDRNREQILQDGALRLLALAWVREKREHGGADWERLLDLTDAEILELHGLKVNGDEDVKVPHADDVVPDVNPVE